MSIESNRFLPEGQYNSPEIRPADITPEPETVERVGVIVDRIQGILEDAYGLESLKLKKASQFLWPKVTADDVERGIREFGGEGAFYTDDGDTSLQVFMDKYEGKPLTERLKNRAKHLRYRAKLLPFESLHPVIYVGSSRMKRVQDVQFPNFLTEENLPDLKTISEEVGHFLYHQSQYKNSRSFPEEIMSESMTLIDWYQILKRVVPESTDKTIFDPSNPQAQAAARSLSEETSLRENAIFINISPETSVYSKGAQIIRGYLEHLINADRSGTAQKEELKKFYLLTGKDKLHYLINLYQKYVDQGNPEFGGSIDYLKDRLTFEVEFNPAWLKDDLKW